MQTHQWRVAIQNHCSCSSSRMRSWSRNRVTIVSRMGGTVIFQRVLVCSVRPRLEQKEGAKTRGTKLPNSRVARTSHERYPLPVWLRLTRHSAWLIWRYRLTKLETASTTTRRRPSNQSSTKAKARLRTSRRRSTWPTGWSRRARCPRSMETIASRRIQGTTASRRIRQSQRRRTVIYSRRHLPMSQIRWLTMLKSKKIRIMKNRVKWRINRQLTKINWSN